MSRNPFNPQDDAQAPEQGFAYYPTAPKLQTQMVGTSIGYAPPPTLQRNSNEARTGGLLAALGALIGGNGRYAGQFGSSFMGGYRQGENEGFARDTQAWNQQRQLTTQQNAETARMIGMQNAATTQDFSNKLREAQWLRTGKQDRLADQRFQIGREDLAWNRARQGNSDRQSQLSYLMRLPKAMREQVAPRIGWEGAVPDLPEPVNGGDREAIITARALLKDPLVTPSTKQQILNDVVMPSLTRGMITNRATPTPATIPQSGPLVPYASPQAAPSPTQTAPAFYPSGMTPNQEQGLAARAAALKQRQGEAKATAGYRSQTLAERGKDREQRASQFTVSRNDRLERDRNMNSIKMMDKMLGDWETGGAKPTPNQIMSTGNELDRIEISVDKDAGLSPEQKAAYKARLAERRAELEQYKGISPQKQAAGAVVKAFGALGSPTPKPKAKPIAQSKPATQSKSAPRVSPRATPQAKATPAPKKPVFAAPKASPTPKASKPAVGTKLKAKSGRTFTITG